MGISKNKSYGVIDFNIFSLSRNDTQVIMVSSSQDVNSTPVYPTHPMQIRASYPNLRFVSDPSMISINGVTIGVTATDFVSQLAEVEMTQ